MKAAIIRRYGPPLVLEVLHDYPKPERRPGEVLVQVHATSVNPVDYKTRKGEFPLPRLTGTLPKILGADLAGVVAEADPGSSFQPGDKVFACSDGAKMWVPWGAYAEFMAVPEALLAAMPSSITFKQAAALPLVALTAYAALQAAGLQPGQRVLIHAGAGGVGSAAVQMAKAQGLHVATTCSTRNLAFVKQELGADEAVDYTEQRFEEVYRDHPFDGVIDAIGADYEARSMSVLKKGGVYVSILASGWAEKFGIGGGAIMTLLGLAKWKLLSLLGRGPRYHLILMDSNGKDLAAIGRLVEEGKLKPIIDKVLPLKQVREAHEYVEQGHTRGKVVLQVIES